MARQADTADMNAELSSLRSDIARLSETMSSLAYREAEHAGTRVKETVGDLTRKGRDIAATAKDKVQEHGTEIEDYISQNPWAAVLVAGGIGLVMGMLSRRSD